MSAHKFLCILMVLPALGGCASNPTEPSSDIQENTSWYEFGWLHESPYAPTFSVLDTESSLGPYAEHAKTITLRDLVRMHGHACDGLVTAAAALSVGLGKLYPDGVIDRTDTGCISNNSPCFGDVAAYLTGGRVRFGTQKIEPNRGLSFVLHRFSTGETIEVKLRDGVFPPEVHALEQKLKGGSFTNVEMRTCQKAQWAFAQDLLMHPLTQSFETRSLENFTWEPNSFEYLSPRGDIINRNRGN